MDQPIDSNVNLRALYEAEKKAREKLQGEYDDTWKILLPLFEQVYHDLGLDLPSLVPDKLYQIAQLIYNIYQYTGKQDEFRAEGQKEEETEKLSLIQQNNSLRDQLKRAIDENIRLQRQIENLVNQKPGPNPENSDKGVSVETDPVKTKTELSRTAIEEIIASKKVLTRLELINALQEAKSISQTEAEQEISASIANGEIALLTTTIKPPYGITFPEVIIARNCEAKRILGALRDFPPNELPILVFAGKEYLPRNGYKFIEIAPTVYFSEQSGDEFTPCLQMLDLEGETIYVMYEGANFGTGKYLDEYLPRFQKLTNEALYFIALNQKIAKSIRAEMDFRNVRTLESNEDLTSKKKAISQAFITNVADWGIYEQKIKDSGNPNLPESIWFTVLTRGK